MPFVLSDHGLGRLLLLPCEHGGIGLPIRQKTAKLGSSWFRIHPDGQLPAVE